MGRRGNEAGDQGAAHPTLNPTRRIYAREGTSCIEICDGWGADPNTGVCRCAPGRHKRGCAARTGRGGIVPCSYLARQSGVAEVDEEVISRRLGVDFGPGILTLFRRTGMSTPSLLAACAVCPRGKAGRRRNVVCTREGEETPHLAGREQGLPQEVLGLVEREMRTDMRGTHIQLLTGSSVANTRCRGPCRHTSCRSVRLGQAYLP